MSRLMLRKQLINLDLWAGRFCALRLPAYIEEKWSRERQGVYSVEEWSHARSSGYRGNDTATGLLDSDKGYRCQLATDNAPAVAAAERLAKVIDFRRYDSVIEIGCGEMAQAYTVVRDHPGIRYRATDFDPYVIEKCSRLQLLNAIEKQVLDVTRLTSADLVGFKLLLGWELVYALDEAALQVVLRAARDARIPFLAATTQLLGPLRYVRRLTRNLDWGGGRHYDRLVRERRIRMHGWNPSLGYYRRQAHHAGLRLTRVWLPPASALDNYTFLLFTPPDFQP